MGVQNYSMILSSFYVSKVFEGLQHSQIIFHRSHEKNSSDIIPLEQILIYGRLFIITQFLPKEPRASQQRQMGLNIGRVERN